MEQTALALVDDTPDVLKARLKREWEAIATRKASGDLDYDVHRARALTTYLGLGLTQREIATCVGISQGWYSNLMRYGRFLDILISLEIKISETQFRQYWAELADHAYLKTLRGQKSESVRLLYEQQVFQKILEKHMKGEETLPDKGKRSRKVADQLSKRVIAQFCDGKFHLLRDITTAVEADMQVVRGICDRIVTKGTHSTFGEKRPAPSAEGGFAYRFVKGGKKKIDLTAFYAEVKPVLDDMEKVINGHSVHFSQQTMQTTFAKFRKVIDRVAR